MRPSRDEYFLRMAELVATRATCPRRNVGCVLTNERNHVIATGYNGVPMGISHCNEDNHQCAGAHAPSGTSLDLCIATHAEANALMQCGNVWDIHTCYCTASPCIHCLKLLMNSSCRRIVFLEEYPNPQGQEMWCTTPHVSKPLGRIHFRRWEHHPKTW